AHFPAIYDCFNITRRPSPAEPKADEAYARAQPAMAASTKTGYDTSPMHWVDTEVAETREDPIPGEDEYLQVMVRQLQEKLATMKPRGSAAAAQPQARKTGSTPAACVESPRQLVTWKPTHMPRIRSDELVIVLKPKITMDLHAAFGPGGIGTAVQRVTGSTTNAGDVSARAAATRRGYEYESADVQALCYSSAASRGIDKPYFG
ncbi:hypothetical protein MRX96_039247, partial [Rhipicephalus microplus]